jgi:hypothetical protein
MIIPFRTVQQDPESFTKSNSVALAFCICSTVTGLLRRDLCHLTEPAYGVAENPGTLCEPILALCCAPNCEVLLATSHPEEAEQGAYLGS